MNPPVIFLGSLVAAISMISCERKPPTATNTSEYREGKSGATSATIDNPKTDEPTPYPAAGDRKEAEKAATGEKDGK